MQTAFSLCTSSSRNSVSPLRHIAEALTPQHQRQSEKRVYRRTAPANGPFSWHNCQQLGDLLRVSVGAGSDATAEAVDGRAEAVQHRDKRSRLIATPDCNSHVEADNGNHNFSPPRQICRAWCRATPSLAARTTSSATLVRSRMEPYWTLGTANHANALISNSSFLIVERISSNEGYSP